MENLKLEELLMQFVRDRASFSDESLMVITSEDNIERSIQYLLSVKRDVESQFIACKTRMNEAYASSQEARRTNTDMTIETETYDFGMKRKTVQTLPPTEAYAKVMAQEGRWKVKNVRFLALIESSIATLKLEEGNTMSPFSTAAVVTPVAV